MSFLEEEYVFALALLVFWLAIHLINKIFNLRKYGFTIYPFFIRYDSKLFKKILYRFSREWKLIWKIFSNLSVVLGFGSMIFVILFLTQNLIKLSLPKGGGTPVSIVIPGLTLSTYWLPYFFLSVALAVFVHEAAHGIVALNEGASINSAGLFLLAVFLGGFVELKDEELKTIRDESKLKIFSAGTAANVLTGLIFFLMLSTLFIQSPSGVVVVEVMKGGPLDLAGIRRWDVIYALNGTPIHTFQDLFIFLSKVKPGERILVSTSRGDFLIATISSPNNSSRAIMGIMFPLLIYYPSRLGLGAFWDIQLYLALNWLFILSVSVAIFNMLPIPTLDGDRFLQCLLQKLPSGGEWMKKFFNIFSIFLLAANVILSYGITF